MARAFSTDRAANILVIGGGYGGLSTALNLLRLGLGKPQKSCPLPPPELGWAPPIPPQITLVDERDGIYHLMGAPLVQTSSAFASESWLRFEEIPALKQSNFRILQGKVSALDVSGRSLDYVCSDGTTRRLEYDYAVLATGKRRPWPVAPRAYSKAAFLLESKLQLTSLSRARRIAVLGGGAVGVEMAAEIKRTWPESLVTLVQSRSSLLSSEPLPAEFKETALKMLKESGVQVRLCCRINDTRKIMKEGSDQPMWEARLSNGDVLLYDELVDTVSRVKPESYVPSSFLNESGKLQVTPTLQLESADKEKERHFAVGDCVSWSGIDRAGNALIMGQYAATNIMKLMKSEKNQGMAIRQPAENQLLVCPEFQPTMVLTIGDKAIIFTPGKGVSSGKAVKDMFVGRGYGIDKCSEYLGLAADDHSLGFT